MKCELIYAFSLSLSHNLPAGGEHDGIIKSRIVVSGGGGGGVVVQRGSWRGRRKKLAQKKRGIRDWGKEKN